MIRDNDLSRTVKLKTLRSYQRDDDDIKCVGRLSKTLLVYASGLNTKYPYFCAVDYSPERGKRSRVALELYLERIKGVFGRDVLSVILVGVDDQYKGFDLAPKFYSYILKHNNFILRSGSSQSFGGKEVWNKLCKQSGVSVYAMHKRTMEYQPCYYSDDGIMCSIDVYAPNSPYYLYAIATK